MTNIRTNSLIFFNSIFSAKIEVRYFLISNKYGGLKHENLTTLAHITIVVDYETEGVGDEWAAILAAGDLGGGW